MQHCVEIILPPQAGTTREEIEMTVIMGMAPYNENQEKTKLPERPVFSMLS